MSSIDLNGSSRRSSMTYNHLDSVGRNEKLGHTFSDNVKEEPGISEKFSNGEEV